MTNLTPERRAALRQTLHYSGQPCFSVERDTLAALLDAADERDRLAEQVERIEELATNAGCLIDGWLQVGAVLADDILRVLDGADS